MRRRFAYPLLAAAAFLASFAVAATRPRPADPADAGRYGASGREPAGPELVMVYLGKSSCAASNHADLPADVEEIKRALAKKAAASGRGFVAVGVALDWSPRSGVEHLEKFGEFDEIAVGRSWGNSLALKYVWKDLPGVSATPQVVVVERTVRLPTTGQRAAELGPERLVARKVGLGEIRRWLDAGTPIPESTGKR